MAYNFFDSGFDDFFGELASLALPMPPAFLHQPLPSPAASNRQNTNQSALGHPHLELPRLRAFGSVRPLSSLSPSGFLPLPGAYEYPWSSSQWQPQPAVQARSGNAASFIISGPTFLHGTPHPPTPMPSTAPASLPEPFIQSTTIGQFQFAPTNPSQPQRPQHTVNNLAHLLSSSRPSGPFHNISGTSTPPAPQQREANSDDFFLNQLTHDFSSPSLPSASAAPQPPATRSDNPNTNNPFSGTRLPRIFPSPASRVPRVAPPVGLRVPPPPSTRSTPTYHTNEEDSDSDSADNMPGSSRQTRRPRSTSSSTGLQLSLPRPPRVSGATSSSSAANTSAQQQANSSKYQSNQARMAERAAPRRASNASVPAAGSTTKRKHDEFELDSFDDDDFFEDKDPEVIDLVDKDVPDATAEEKEKEEDKKKKWIKLSQFQCVICLDDVTDLTVTYCGHLFCSECLHSALQITPHKRICPICRQKIDNKNASGKFGPKAKGYYPLEIKLMTKKSLGKRAAPSRNLGEH